MVEWWWVPVAGVIGALIVIIYSIIRTGNDFYDGDGEI